MCGGITCRVESLRYSSVRQRVDPTAQVLRAQRFDPFGNVLEQARVANSAFGYTGEQTDPTGLVFLWARYWNTKVAKRLEKRERRALPRCFCDNFAFFMFQPSNPPVLQPGLLAGQVL
jgi:hypothetical protein